MTISKPIAALAAGCLMLLGAAALAQNGGGRGAAETPGVQALVLAELARLDWIEKSDVAALREGVIEKMELQIGMPVKKGGTIGILHHEIAELTVAKNKLQAESIGPEGEGRGPEGSRRLGRRPQQAAQRAQAGHGLGRGRRQGRGRAEGRRRP